jgi:phospholipase D-like protein
VNGKKQRGVPAVHIHHKFIVIDAATATPTIYTGSANMSNNSVHRNDENLLEITGSPSLAQAYFAEFMRLYEHYRARDLESDAYEEQEAEAEGGRGQVVARCAGVEAHARRVGQGRVHDWNGRGPGARVVVGSPGLNFARSPESIRSAQRACARCVAPSGDAVSPGYRESEYGSAQSRRSLAPCLRGPVCQSPYSCPEYYLLGVTVIVGRPFAPSPVGFNEEST